MEIKLESLKRVQCASRLITWAHFRFNHITKNSGLMKVDDYEGMKISLENFMELFIDIDTFAQKRTVWIVA